MLRFQSCLHTIRTPAGLLSHGMTRTQKAGPSPDCNPRFPTPEAQDSAAPSTSHFTPLPPAHTTSPGNPGIRAEETEASQTTPQRVPAVAPTPHTHPTTCSLILTGMCAYLGSGARPSSSGLGLPCRGVHSARGTRRPGATRVLAYRSPSEAQASSRTAAQRARRPSRILGGRRGGRVSRWSAKAWLETLGPRGSADSSPPGWGLPHLARQDL